MCGRYERRGDKQKIAEAFYAKGGLDEVDFGEDFDCAPGSNQPVVWMNKEGERALGLMRWGFKLPKKLLFNVRSEGIATANFWKDKFATNRCIVPASSFFEWKDSKKGPKSKYEIKSSRSRVLRDSGSLGRMEKSENTEMGKDVRDVYERAEWHHEGTS